MLPTNVYGINLGHRMFDPVYAAAQEIGMPLSVHPQTEHDGQYGVWGVMGAGSERMEKYSYVHMTSFPFELMIALMHMIGEGVFDRYPKLKVGFMEGACGWLPFWSERMDEHFHKLRPQWPLLKRKPSEIIKSSASRFHLRAGRNYFALRARRYRHHASDVCLRLPPLGLGVSRLGERSEENSRHDRRQAPPRPRRECAQLVQSERRRFAGEINR